MADKSDLVEWLRAGLEAQDGRATILDVCRWVWHEHGKDLERSGDLFYTWQYDIRWAATKLRKTGVIRLQALR